MSRTTKLTAKSQITIPADVRRRLGIGPGDRVAVEIEEGRAVLIPIKGTRTEQIAGLGSEIWKAVGGGAGWLEGERDAWDRR